MISVKNLNKTYDRGHRNANHVLHDISVELPQTGFVCIVGASGCGKTSLLNAIGGLDTFDDGVISTNNVSVSRYGTREMEAERNQSFGYIFQNYYLLTDHSVAYNIYLGLHSLDLTHKEKLMRVHEALKAVNMPRYGRRIVGELSGGQQQRVAIARALARRPRVIFADEPTGNLDEANTFNICSLLRKISRTSLVVMVTHEANIAQFFADRIITIADGRIVNDQSDWQRGTLSSGSQDIIYTKEYTESSPETAEFSFRVLTQTNAAPLEMSIVVENNRIVIKSSDPRKIVISGEQEVPRLVETTRPQVTLDAIDDQFEDVQTDDIPVKTLHAGAGISFSMLLQEAWQMLYGRGLKKLGVWFFLAAMTVLSIWIVGDYLTIRAVDPEDFIVSDSHILELDFDRGEFTELNPSQILYEIQAYKEQFLDLSKQDFDYIPNVSAAMEYIPDLYLQMGSLSEIISGFSYVPLHRLDESKLIAGRMPETTEEVVIDRWIIDRFLEKDGIIQSGVSDISFFLNKSLTYAKKSYSPKIVGICDTNEPSVYISPAGLISIGLAGTELMPLRDAKILFPDIFENITLEQDECIMITNVAGPMYANRVGSHTDIRCGMQFTIKDAVEADTYASMVVSDEVIDTILYEMTSATTSFTLYCSDKESMKAMIDAPLPDTFEGYLRVKVADRYSDAMNRYLEASQLRADARLIVTLTVLLLSMVMLYLLKRSGIQERIGMVAVYRLLGIPGYKLITVFVLESVILSFSSVLPAGVVMWLVVLILTNLPSLAFSMVLPWQAILVIGAVIFLYHLFVSILPILKLLRIPPAQLASKYDI